MSKRLRVLSLYRQLFRYSRELELTDQDYFCDRLRKLFKNNRGLPKADTEKQIQRAEQVLKERRFI